MTTIPLDVTVDDLVDEVISTVVGASSGNLAVLTSPVTATDLTLDLDSVSQVSRCIVEIDEELMLVSSVDPGTNTATVFAKGRGYRGTVAASHDSGSIVSIAPALSRASVLREINNEVVGLYPDLTAPSIEMSVSTDGWVPIPEDAVDVLDVSVKNGSYWERLRHWEAWASAPEDVSYSGRAVKCPTLPNATEVQVTVGLRPEPFASTTETFESCGLPDSCRPLVVQGVILRLLPAFDSYRLTMAQVGDSSQAQLGPASVLAREVKSRRADLLAREVKALRNLYPARVHFTT